VNQRVPLSEVRIGGGTYPTEGRGVGKLYREVPAKPQKAA
jgi:hypothetical protein